MNATEQQQWITLLSRTSELGRGDPPENAAPWFLAWRRSEGVRTATPDRPDDRLWSALTSPETRPVASRMIDASDAPASLFPFTGEDTLEVWTERDLCGMHALWWLAHELNDESMRLRLDQAALWHLEHTQPDNATGRPWAVHVFALRWVEHDDAESRLYAETLLHNCRMVTGSPDPLSCEILADAHDALLAQEQRERN